ncbi:MAG TPA: tyrosine recombinase XerC [Candidatus Thioglobus sp.]|jgi:integrase/recombinase XerC|nr:tyrosine recombinase XerC [Candidatus Thioglobus sp.]HIL42445.1 tyrosine recombinase XerC [Gammaproteobacteria bacterium]
MNNNIVAFVQYLKVERHYALNTQQAYSRDLTKLLHFVKSHNLYSWEHLTVEHLNLFVMGLRSKQMSSRTIRRNLSSIRGFLAYLVDQNLLQQNCSLGVHTPKIDSKLPKTLDYEKLLKMVIPMSSNWKELRDVAIVEVIYSCGLRVSELVNLNVGDIDMGQGYITVTGKGSKMRHTPIGESAIKSISTYLEKTSTNKALFVNNSNKRISVRSVQNLVKKRAIDAGITINVYPHMLRHAAATHFLQSSHDLRSVQEFLGHKSIKSTQVYTHLDFLELSKVYDKCHPRAKK